MATYNTAPFDQDGSNGSTVSFTATTDEVDANSVAKYVYKIEVGDADPNQNLNADVTVTLLANGSTLFNDSGDILENNTLVVDQQEFSVEENATIQDSISYIPPTNKALQESIRIAERREAIGGVEERRQADTSSYPRIDAPIWINVTVDYYDEGGGFARGTIDEKNISTVGAELTVTNPFDAPEPADVADPDINQDTPLTDTFDERVPFKIKDIEYEDDAQVVDSVYDKTSSDEINSDGTYNILLEDKNEGNNFPNPTVSVDTAGRFVKHEIIGGATVRQKVGEDPINISVSGVCKRRTANQIDSLRNAKSGTIISDRLPSSSAGIRVQFGSTMTEPMEDGGAADIVDGEYLYTFQINAIEVTR
jgi:hypothetical protein